VANLREVNVNSWTSAAGLALAAVLTAGPALAAGDPPALLGIFGGHFDQELVDTDIGPLKIDEGGTRDQAVDLRVEYRFGTSLVPMIDDYATLRPLAALHVTTDGAVYAAGGLALDFQLGPVVITPSVAAGLYEKGGGKDLGHPVEFRTQLEIGYVFENEMRLTLALSHMSNAGLDDDNPGVNTIGAYIHMPIASLFGS
jgi:lipid A 3-O-deacylase